jgi:uncharacterized membrane protein YecN with MAPEG domain
VTGTHLRDLSVALAAAVPALVLVALSILGAVLGVAAVAVVGVVLAIARTCSARPMWTTRRFRSRASGSSGPAAEGHRH